MRTLKSQQPKSQTVQLENGQKLQTKKKNKKKKIEEDIQMAVKHLKRY